MFNNKYVSLNQVIDRVKRGSFYKSLPQESAIDYGVQAFRLLASEKALVSQPAKIEIQDYRGILPANLEFIIQTVKVDADMKNMIAMRYATDNFQSMLHCTNSGDLSCNSEYTYSLNNNYIQTSFKDGYVFMAYQGLPQDKDCNLIVPDNVNVLLAIEYYIKYRFLDDLGSDEPRIQKQQQSDEQQYCWYIGKAQAHMTAMTQDEYESFANSMSKFFDTENYHSRFMKNLGSQEFIRNVRNG